MISLFLLFAAHAAPIDEAAARQLAVRFYGLTGRPPAEEAFLADDVAALVESGREPEELEQAVVWIARNVPGADRYTLSGILESHLATALGEPEELDRPPEPTLSLAAAPELRRFEPSAALVQELLDAYYAGIGQDSPSPPREADLAAIASLTREGWGEAGLRELVDWVPRNVRGAEMLGFAEAAALAQTDRGYLGGPRSTGELETLRGLSRRPPPAPLWGERDPYAFDGGQLSGFATTNALPSAVDLDPTRLAGSTLRWVEASARASGEAPGGTILVAQGSERWGFVLEGGVLDHASGARDADRFGLDGGLPFAAEAEAGRATYGRFTLGGGQTLPLGAQLWGVSGPDRAGAGASASIRFAASHPFSLSATLGAGALTLPRGTQDTTAVLLVTEIGPSWQNGDWFAEGRLRVGLSSGGLVADEFPVEDDRYSAGSGQGVLRLGQRTERTSWALGLGLEGQRWSLDWQENDRVRVQEFAEAGGGGELEMFGGLRYGVRRNLWLSGGARVSAGWGEAADIGAEAGLGISALIWEKAWINVAGRGGHGAELDASVAVPF